MISLNYENFIFDCDSTLTKIEGLENLVPDNKRDLIAEITDRGMNGEITFEESLNKRMSIIRPKLEDIVDLGEKYINAQTDGAKTLVALIKQLGGNVFILSGGPKVALDIFGEYLGVDKKSIYGVEIDFDKFGNYVQISPNSDLAKDTGKGLVVKRIQSGGGAVMVGDGATDLIAAKECDLFIGFGGIKKREIMESKCKNYYTQGNLLGLMDYFCCINVSIKGKNVRH